MFFLATFRYHVKRRAVLIDIDTIAYVWESTKNIPEVKELPGCLADRSQKLACCQFPQKSSQSH